MPIYEYRCSACGKVSEILQRGNDKPLKKCPECSGAVEKIVSRSSFQLKGTGWYVTDYGRKGAGHSGSDRSKGSDTSHDSGSDKGTDTASDKSSDKGSDKGASGKSKSGSRKSGGGSSHKEG